MISTAINNPDRDFRQEFTSTVTEISKKSHKRLHNQHITGQRSLRKRELSRFEIEETLHRGIEEEKVLNNRLKYIESERQRNFRTLELARRKYEKIMQVRAQSIKEKQECKQKLQQAQKQIAREISSRADKVRQQKSRIVQSVQKVRECNKLEAITIRCLSLQLEDNIKTQRQAQVEHKKQLVEKVQASLQESRTFLNQIQEQRIKGSKAIHRSYLQQKLQVNYAQQRKNSILKQKLHQSLLNANKDIKICFEQLRTYQTITPKYKTRSLHMQS